jgi:hypothetical protein
MEATNMKGELNMAKINVIIAGLLVAIGSNVFGIVQPAEKGKSLIRVGIFDSRAAACAWGRSQAFRKQLSNMRAEYKEAKARGDTTRVKKLEIEGPKSQDRMHRQVFGNEPIDDVLKKIDKDLPEIAKSAGVDMIVSQWEIVYQKQSLKFVDVTWEMVNLFEPDKKTVKVIKELLRQKPVPSEELETLKDW